MRNDGNQRWETSGNGRAQPRLQTFPPGRNKHCDHPISGKPGAPTGTAQTACFRTGALVKAMSGSPDGGNVADVCTATQYGSRASNTCCSAERMTTRRERHGGLRTGERFRVPACARHDQRSAVRGYVRRTWNRMRGGGGADIRFGSGCVGRCDWMASSGILEPPQTSGIQASGDGAGCSA